MANWFVRSGAAGSGTGADWTNAFTTIGAAITAAAAGDTFFVANDHSQTQASALTMTFPGTAGNPNKVYSVDQTQASPGGAHLLAGARIATTGNNAMTVNGSFEAYGIRFAVADSTSLPHLTLCGTTGRQTYRTCIFDFTNTTGAQSCFIGVNTSDTSTEVLWDNNCRFLTGNTTQAITPRNARFTWRNATSPVTTTSLAPLNPIGSITTETNSFITLQGLDLSGMPAGRGVLAARASSDQIVIDGCKLPTYIVYNTDVVTAVGAQIDVTRSESASGVNYGHRRYRYAGSQIQSATVTRASGASDGTTAYSWAIATTANSSWMLPFQSMPSGTWNDAVGASITVTLEGISNSAALPQNDEIWIEASAIGDANYPLSVFANSARANGLTTAANYTASTESWGATAAARANSTAYALGAAIATSTNAGRVFFCTSAGTSAASEPAGFATAIDGGAVTDGTATFRAGWRFKMSASLTPQQAGPVMVRVQAAEPSGTWYIDPAIAVT